MSKQMTLSSFIKVSNKRPLLTTATEDCPKKVKNDSIQTSGNKSDVNSCSYTDGNDQSSPSKDSPHRMRLELIEWNKKFPVISKNIGLTWYPALRPEFSKPYFSELNSFVESERKKNEVYPPPEKVWSWTQACTMDNVKVVILGQDPYHNPGQAHGNHTKNMDKSLVNMYKELESDIEGFVRPKHGYLIGWARQGVLMLNACLTVTKNSPNSHKDQGWENLTSAVIKHLNDNYSNIVFLLWGSYAQKKAEFVDKKRHHILKSVHPSPLSAARGYFGCKHFSKCNEILINAGKEPIDWKKLPTE